MITGQFDVAELGLTYYLRTLDLEDPPFTALPIFPNRNFRHSAIFINTSSGIRRPQDQAGKTVGEFALYRHDAGVWPKGILSDNFGITPDQCSWVIGGTDHPIPSFDWIPQPVPAGVQVQHAEEGRTLGEMLEIGELDALFSVDVPRALLAGSPCVARLFPDYEAVERDYFRRNGIFPPMHVIAIRTELVERPGLLRVLQEAYSRAGSPKASPSPGEPMYTIVPRGAFDLDESARFAFIDREAGPVEPSTMRLAFCRDRTWEPTGAHLTQNAGPVQVAGQARDRPQVERILGLDVDASGFADVGARDPVIGRLQAAAPGLRPPQLHSAYEAAAFCILTARRSATQARRMRARMAEQAGTVLDVSGQPVVCLPPPAYLVDPEPTPGVDRVRRQRLQAVAQAALDGLLDTAELAALPPEDARTQLERLPGIGPFSSAIVAARALGHTDYLAGPITELNATVGQLYDLGQPATPDELAAISSAWSPWRTWSQLHIRSVSPRLSAAPA